MKTPISWGVLGYEVTDSGYEFMDKDSECDGNKNKQQRGSTAMLLLITKCDTILLYLISGPRIDECKN